MTDIINFLGIPSSPYLKSAVTILLFIVIARLSDFFFSKILKRFTRFTETDVDDRIIALAHKPIFFTVLLIGVALSVMYLELPQKVVFYSEGLLYSFLTVLWMITFIRICSILIEYILQRQADVSGLHKDIMPVVENISKIAIIAVSLMVLLSLWKINITPLLASAGIAGAVVAFAAKDTMSNIFGGISIFFDKPFKIGDYIILDQGERGEVVSIGIRSTRIKTRDDIMITVPNSIIANSKIINESAPIPKFRTRVPVSIAYGSDIDLVEKVLLEIASGNDNISREPASRVRFRAFGDSALNFELLCWTMEPSLRGKTIHELNSEIYKRFNSEGIRIPFPQRDVHIYRDEA
jgi:small-conductance mechanosensitive channel